MILFELQPVATISSLSDYSIVNPERCFKKIIVAININSCLRRTSCRVPKERATLLYGPKCRLNFEHFLVKICHTCYGNVPK